MVDDDIKKLLIELNMPHLVEEFEKIPVKAPQPQMREKRLKDIRFSEIDESEDSELEEKRLKEQVQEVNKILVGSRKKLKWTVFTAFVLALAIGGFYLSEKYQMGEGSLQQLVSDPHIEKINPDQTKVQAEPNQVQPSAKIPSSSRSLDKAKETLTKLCQEREANLKNSAQEIQTFITNHAAKKEPFFASKLSLLCAKCQQLDEEYEIKIENEVKAFESAFKEQNSEEQMLSYQELLKSLGL